jgi:hypothetical protein
MNNIDKKILHDFAKWLYENRFKISHKNYTQQVNAYLKSINYKEEKINLSDLCHCHAPNCYTGICPNCGK